MAVDDVSRMRVSDADRDQVAETLREAAAVGRVTLDELDDRLNAAYKAKTYADLEPLTADLPEGASVTPAPGNTPAAASQGGAVHDRSGKPLVINAKGSHIVRKGHWESAARNEVHNRWGVSMLDFREAVLRSPVVEIHLDSSAGLGDIILPDGATAEVDVDASMFGTLQVNVDTVRKQGVPHFTITGACRGGTMRIRYKRRFGAGWINS